METASCGTELSKRDDKTLSGEPYRDCPAHGAPRPVLQAAEYPLEFGVAPIRVVVEQ
ncbi:MAG: hypothetical protein HQK85_10375, partial [Nitrospinae bacterium]|nr:hypothetical protein [Nitrospinota bacterium]